MEIKESMLNKFQEVTNIDLNKLDDCKVNIELATFNKFSVTDDINLKLLAIQDCNSKFVKLASKKNVADGKATGTKKVWLFMIKNNKIIKFYDCYLVEKSDKKPVKLSEQKTEISVTPTKSDNTRTASKSLVNLIVKPEQKAIEQKEVKQIALTTDKKEVNEIESLKSEISSVNAKFDLLIEMMNKLQK